VEAQAVGLHHDVQVGPVEVDPEAVHVHLRERLRQPRRACDRQEELLELGVGEGERVAVEDRAQPAGRVFHGLA
jgi:hypothetical protein